MVSTADLRKQLEREKKIAKKEAERREIKRELKTLKRRKIISFGRAVGRGGRVAGKAAGAFGKGVSKVIQAIPDPQQVPSDRRLGNRVHKKSKKASGRIRNKARRRIPMQRRTLPVQGERVQSTGLPDFLQDL